MKTTRLPSRPLAFIGVLGGLTAGCAGPGATFVRGPFIAADYEQVYVTGSHIPVLVPKNPGIRGVPNTSPLVIMSPDDLRRAMSPSAFPMH